MSYWQLVADQAEAERNALQDPGELAILLALLDSHQAKRVVEVGTWAGGTAWALAQVRSIGQVVAVDNDPQPGLWRNALHQSPKVDLVRGDSHLDQTRDIVVARLGGYNADMVLIDGDHSYAGTKRDVALYESLVKPGGLLVIHDTQGFPGRPDIEVPRLWAEIRADYPATELVTKPGGPHGTGIVWL